MESVTIEERLGWTEWHFDHLTRDWTEVWGAKNPVRVGRNGGLQAEREFWHPTAAPGHPGLDR
jgi:hypothetical protein